MLLEEKDIPLVERIPELNEYIEDHASYLDHNTKILEIYEGDLMPKVLKVMESTLSESYYKMIKERVLPINFLPRMTDKMAQVYSKAPKRTCEDEQPFIDNMVKYLSLDAEMSIADEYSNLFKGYALEPYVSDDKKPSIRSIPFDQFLVKSDSVVDRRRPTVFIKFMGSYSKTYKIANSTKTEEKECLWYIAYTDYEIVAFDADNEWLEGETIGTDHLNPIGRIPFVYGNRSKQRLIPTQDTDILQLIMMFPILFSDLGGSVMFQCFTIMYGIDVDSSDLKMNPNAFWDFKSDPKAEGKTPKVGTIKPEADVEKVLKFIASVFSAWAESKSIRVNSIGTESAESFASGVSKAIDEMDTFMVRKKNIPFFEKEEAELWHIMALLNNNWLGTDQIDLELYEISIVDVKTVIKNFIIEFETPKPIENRNDVVKTQKEEYDNGFTTMSRAISKINPEFSEKEVEKLIQDIMKEKKKFDDLMNDEDNKENDDIEEKEKPKNLEE